MKPRIKVRSMADNCHVIFNGGNWAVVHKSDIKAGLLEHVEYLRRISCNWTADQILKCVVMN